MAARATRFKVDYTYGKTMTSSRTRAKISTSMTNLQPPGARSEMAIRAYLRKKHPGLEIMIMNLEFQDTSGKPV